MSDLERFRVNMQRLDTIRSAACSNAHVREAERHDILVEVDGDSIDDIPTFYIALGEAVHGPGGYYGGCLDALDDCLFGGFGLIPPFTLRLKNSDRLKQVLGREARQMWLDEWERSLLEDGGAELAADRGFPCDPLTDDDPTYFDSLVEVLQRRNVTVELA